MKSRRLPDWLKVKLPAGEKYRKVREIISLNNLHTVCESARCPNMGECWGCGTATFMILGDVCTRDCRYCNVLSGVPGKIDTKEPKNVADAVKRLGLKYAVITSVTRDDLKDGGAGVFFETVKGIKEKNPKTKVELLIPDFKGDSKALSKVVNSGADVVGHNIEITKKIFRKLRPKGNYKTSLALLKNIKKISPKIITKSGLMIGFGETKEQIIETLKDLRKAEADIVTIGQYLQPSKDNAEAVKFYSPAEFEELKKTALKMGFKHAESGPLVRSSYHAEQSVKTINL